ncbi:MAG: hypothetical protein RRA35_11685, partial [Desulfomonilia bacterium]|nr:hypothetical protein [Desulfomonilia bacterium]
MEQDKTVVAGNNTIEFPDVEIKKDRALTDPAFFTLGVIPKATRTTRLADPPPVLRLSTTPSRNRNRYRLCIGRRWKAFTEASRLSTILLTVPALTGSPNIGNNAWATLRVDSPKTKQDKIIRSTWCTRRAYVRITHTALAFLVLG